MTHRLASRMMRLLERERAMLIAGNIDGAVKLTSAKDKLAEKLMAALPDEEAVAAIRDSAERNRRLIDAAKRGVESAQRRIASLRRGVGVNTYSASGARNLISRTQGTLHKRA